MDDKGIENAAILLMSLGEEEASEVFKHLSPKEVQALGEQIARLKVIKRAQVEGQASACGADRLEAHGRQMLRAAGAPRIGEDEGRTFMQGSQRPRLRSLGHEFAGRIHKPPETRTMEPVV